MAETSSALAPAWHSAAASPNFDRARANHFSTGWYGTGPAAWAVAMSPDSVAQSWLTAEKLPSPASWDTAPRSAVIEFRAAWPPLSYQARMRRAAFARAGAFLAAACGAGALVAAMGLGVFAPLMATPITPRTSSPASNARTALRVR